MIEESMVFWIGALTFGLSSLMFTVLENRNQLRKKCLIHMCLLVSSLLSHIVSWP
jgi:hypothetical protein